MGQGGFEQLGSNATVRLLNMEVSLKRSLTPGAVKHLFFERHPAKWNWFFFRYISIFSYKYIQDELKVIR